MKSHWMAVLAAVLSVAAFGCADASRSAAFLVGRNKVAVIPPPGVLFTSVKAPISAGVSGKPLGGRRGTATAHSIGIPPNPLTGWRGIPIITWGDMSEKQALANGGISSPSHVDYDSLSVLMVYRRLTLVAYGE